MRTRNLLLGSATGLLSVTAAYAADLPVKAKPVDYVRVCNLYGAGFYYMPGSDLCLKIGGYMRAEAGWGYNGSFVGGPFNGNAGSRSTNNLLFRGRGYITADAREQTAYGTARGYIAVGISTNDVGLNTPANQFSAKRAFVQFAGFTAGIGRSFYDFYETEAVGYNGGIYPSSNTGDVGWMQIGYTAELGNGLSATLATESRRTTQIIDASSMSFAAPTFSSVAGGSLVAGGYPTASPGATANNGAYGGQQLGDIVGNLALQQAWGSAQIMGALHDVNGTYYSTAIGGAPSAGFVGPGGANVGHPGDAWGWAAGAGLHLNFPMIGEGDYFQAQVNLTEGAERYLFFSENSNWGKVDHAHLAYGVLSDCVYGGTLGTGTATGCNLTTAWGFNAAYEHHWSPAWQTSVYGGQTAVSYNNQANAMLCSSAGFGVGTGTAAAAAAGCNNDWSVWYIGSRTQWNVSKSFYLGVDTMYEQLNSATTGSAGAPLGYAGGITSATALGGAAGTQAHASNWTIRFRAHRDFLP
jgi:Porin subfamily